MIRAFLKQWVRPALIPVLRLFVRYVPFSALRRTLWKTVIGPYFQHARHDYVSKTVFGCFFAGNTVDLIQRYIYYFGIWEPNLTNLIAARLKPGDFFIDIGANIGYFSLQASRLIGPSGKVIAIEASPSIFAQLKNNVQRNGPDNIELHNLAISDRLGTLQIFLGQEGNIGETTSIAGGGSPSEAEVPAMPLTALVSPDIMARVRFIKVDVEGAEAAVVAGMQPLLAHARADLEIVVEIGPEHQDQQGKKTSVIMNTFVQYGFVPYRLENDYSPLSYLSGKPPRKPEPILDPITSQTDVLFTRIGVTH